MGASDPTHRGRGPYRGRVEAARRELGINTDQVVGHSSRRDATEAIWQGDLGKTNPSDLSWRSIG